MIFLIAKKTKSMKIHPMTEIAGAITDANHALTIADDLTSGDPKAHAFVGIPIDQGAKYEIFQVRDLDAKIVEENQRLIKKFVDNAHGEEP